MIDDDPWRERRQRTVAVVVPTLGRPSLRATIGSLDDAAFDPRLRLTGVVLVDDRPPSHPAASAPLDALAVFGWPMLDRCAAGGAGPHVAGTPISVVRSGGRGPAAARNAGVAVTTADWVVTLDDDVRVEADWWHRLADDLDRACAPPDLVRRTDDPVGAVFGSIDVPLPADRPPTDWERHTARLSTARWITADAAIRRAAFDAVGGFDEAFRRAYREDSDLALRMLDGGWRLEQGSRRCTHPPRPSGLLASVAVERGNADDVRMRAKHGPAFRERLGERGRMQQLHAVTTGAAAGALVAAGVGRLRVASGLAALWLGSTLWFAARRIAPGPRDRREVVAMVVSSVAIPPAAVVHRGRGHWAVRHERRTSGTAT